MQNTISFKTQSQRSTKWHDKKAINVNLFYKDVQIGLVTSGAWGSFDNEEPKVEIEIGGQDYSFSLSDFKKLIKDNLKPIE